VATAWVWQPIMSWSVIDMKLMFRFFASLRISWTVILPSEALEWMCMSIIIV